MKVRELMEANRPYFAVDYIEIFNSDDPTPGRLELGNLDMTKIPVQLKGSEYTIYVFDNNNLSTFDNFPDAAKEIRCNRNKFTSLHDIHKHITKMETLGNMGRLYFMDNPIKSHVLGLLKIPGLRMVLFTAGPTSDKTLTLVGRIVNTYLPNVRGNDAVLECQNELIDAGLEDFAQL